MTHSVVSLTIAAEIVINRDSVQLFWFGSKNSMHWVPITNLLLFWFDSYQQQRSGVGRSKRRSCFHLVNINAIYTWSKTPRVYVILRNVIHSVNYRGTEMLVIGIGIEASLYGCPWILTSSSSVVIKPQMIWKWCHSWFQQSKSLTYLITYVLHHFTPVQHSSGH